MQKLGKEIGCTLIITGTCVGAGMLALPLVTANCGFLVSMFLLIACWALMTTTALFFLEVNLAFKPGTSFDTMSFHTLGKIGRFITWLTILLLLYSVVSAYISGGSSLLVTAFDLFWHIKISNVISAVVFTCVLGGVVVSGTGPVDYTNRVLIALKFSIFAFIIVVLVPSVKLTLLTQKLVHFQYALYALPILLASFGFHVVLPSIRTYFGDDVKRLRRIVFVGTGLPLVIYFIWEIVTLGVLPLFGEHSFTAIHNTNGSVGALVLNLRDYLNKPTVTYGFDLFTDIAVTTSFLGASLGLFDFIHDGLQFKKRTVLSRSITAIATFGLPLSFALFYPEGFILALGYAGIFSAISLVILPALMVLKLRKSGLKSQYTVNVGKPILWIVIASGLFVIFLQVLVNFGYMQG